MSRRTCSSGSAPAPILTALGEVAEIFRECLTPREDIVGHVQDILKLAVPGDQMLRFVEHGDTVAHVLERDAEFLLALTDFIQQPRILHRDHRLGGEVLQQRDFLVGERADFLADTR